MSRADAIRKSLDLLTTDSPDSPDLWKAFQDKLRECYNEFSGGIGKYVPEERLLELLTLLLIPVARNGFANGIRCQQLFTVAEKMGVHILPVHFYSPVPDTATLTNRPWESRFDDSPGWDLNVAGQLALLERLTPFAAELNGTPETSETGFAWRNAAITPTDAALYYCMIRHLRPRRVIEVGAGYSTLIAAQACVRNGDTELIAIDPYPLPILNEPRPGLAKLIRTPVQELDPAFFAESLGPSDILFIDSTHVSKIDSDVNHLLLRVLPRLAAGVTIHVHDIFLPWDYPESWIREKHIFWNEQYLLLALMLLNRSCRVLLGAQYLGREHPQALRDMFPMFPPDFAPGGGSFWLSSAGGA